MKRVILLFVIFCFVASLAYAAEAGTMTLKGTIIDNMCASSQKPADLPKFIKTHPKSCAVLPNCAATGYSIYADGKLQKFDKASSAKVEAFLKKADSKLNVTVVVKKSGNELSLVSIQNQK